MGAVLIPVHLSENKGGQATGNPQVFAGAGRSSQVPERERDVMDDLVDQLAALDSKSSRGT
jgi:hypothetical protein